MTWITARSGCSRAFTLIEIMLVLALIAIVFLGAAPLVSASMRETRLRNAAADIADFAREQRMKAEESGVRRQFEFNSDGIYGWNADGNPENVIATPVKAQLQVRYPGGDWSDADGQRWEFSPIGFVTPLSVRLEEGNDWIELDFDLLTGRVAEERYAF